MWTSPTLTPVFILVILAVKQIEGRERDYRALTYKTTLTVKTTSTVNINSIIFLKGSY